MPEYNELLSSYLVIRHWLDSIRQRRTDRPLWTSLRVDSTKSEDTQRVANSEVSLSEAAEDFSKVHLPTYVNNTTPINTKRPFTIRRSHCIVRGTSSNQQDVYPPVNLAMGNLSYCRPTLVDVHFHPRNVVFHFKVERPTEHDMWMRVQMLTHTMVQIYDKTEFIEGICSVNKMERKSRIGLALGLVLPSQDGPDTDYFIVFQSMDMLFSVCYSDTLDGLGISMSNVFFDFEAVLRDTIEWVVQRRNSDADRFKCLAINSIRDASTVHSAVFAGVGVYTASEIFFMAGLSPDLTEGEVFDNASRFARVMEGYYTYAHNAHTSLWEFIRPFLHERYFLAVKNSDRVRYARRLHVYAKSRSELPCRFKAQIVELNTLLASKAVVERSRTAPNFFNPSISEYFDAFEPSFIRAGLEKAQNLGCLVFGKETWSTMGGTLWLENPLVDYFRNNVALFRRRKTDNIAPDPWNDILFSPKSTYLHSLLFFQGSQYQGDQVFLDGDDLTGSWARTYLYEDNKKDIWSVINIVGRTSIFKNGSTSVQDLTPALDDKWRKRTFQYIVEQTNGYVVGPLDFSGTGFIYHRQVLVCRGDPKAPAYVSQRQANVSRRDHKKSNPKKKKKSKKVSLDVVQLPVPASSSTTTVTAALSLTEETRPSKRQCISADRKLALTAQEFEGVGGRITRHSSRSK